MNKSTPISSLVATGNEQYRTIGSSTNRYRFVELRCVCGTVFWVRASKVKAGDTKSCGCRKGYTPNYYNDNGEHFNRKHGLTGNPAFSVWNGMKQRCYNKRSTSYHRYGGRGIRICDRWLNDPASFVEWAYQNGYQKGLTIDRIDNDGDYTPENCRWVTNDVQALNKSNNHLVAAFGETKTLKEWSVHRRCKVKYRTLRSRINNYGWDAEAAIITPVLRYRSTSTLGQKRI